MNIQLSISLLASDRINSLERCLDSLKPLLQQISSELIVVFTGTDEKVRKLAERYTDNIIPFTWCDDFSAARNVGLKVAKGEWFLFIDDDEWFEDVGEIVEFFISGEYQKYYSACYIQRNYENWDGIGYGDFSAFRMARRIDDLKFQNPIHEILSPYVRPTKYFQVYAHHYGYVLNHNGKRDFKADRNIPLLLKDIEKNPLYVKNYLQLVKEYDAQSNWKQALAYCRKGYQIAKDRKEMSMQYACVLYLAVVFTRMPDKQRAVSELELLLKEETFPEIVRLVIYEHLVNLYKQLDEPEKAIEYGREYEKLLCMIDQNPELWTQQMLMEYDERNIKEMKRTLYRRTNCIYSALEMGDMQSVEYFLKLLPWADEHSLQPYYSKFDEWIEKFGTKFAELLSRLPYDCSYLLRQKLLDTLEKKQLNKIQKLFAQCLNKTEDAYQRSKLIQIGLLNQLDLSSLIEKLDWVEWKKYAEKAIAESELQDMEVIKVSVKIWKKKYPLQSLYVDKLLLEKQLLQGYLNGSELINTLQMYCEYILDFYRSIYQDGMFTEQNRSFLPKEGQFAMIMLEVLEKFQQREWIETVHLSKSALRCFPEMKGVIWEIVHKAKLNMENPQMSAGEEFQQLAVQMKEALHTMISNGQYMEAMAVLTKLLPLLPEDLDLLKVKQKILLEMK